MTPRESDFQPDKEREYRLFLVWLNMSTPMKTLGHDFLDQEGIHNPDIRELAGIKTQKQFAEKYGLSVDTLTDWKKQPVPERYQDISWRIWLKEMKPEIVRLVASGLRQRKDPASAKFLLELDGEYVQRSEIKVDGTAELFEGLKQIAERLED